MMHTTPGRDKQLIDLTSFSGESINSEVSDLYNKVRNLEAEVERLSEIVTVLMMK